MARKTKLASSVIPVMTLAERGRRIPRRVAGMVTRLGTPGAPTLVTVVIGSRLPPGSRIEEHVDEVADQVRGEHGERNDQEQALQQRVVVVKHRLLEQVADAGVGEDDLGEQRSGYHE